MRAVLHEPPRRVLAPLPFSPISVSDYLFPGEGSVDSLASLADLLDLGTLLEGDVQVRNRSSTKHCVSILLPSFLFFCGPSWLSRLSKLPATLRCFLVIDFPRSLFILVRGSKGKCY